MSVFDRVMRLRVELLGDDLGPRYAELEERYRPGGGGLTEQERDEHNLLRWMAIGRVNELKRRTGAKK